MPREALQGGSEDAGYEQAKERTESRDLRVESTTPDDFRFVPHRLEEDLSKMVGDAEAPLYHPVGHAPGGIEVENFFVGVDAVGTQASNSADPVPVGPAGNRERRMGHAGP